jgi:hypothetical protein
MGTRESAFFRMSRPIVLRQLGYKSEFIRGICVHGTFMGGFAERGRVQLQGFEFHWKINIDQTDGIYYKEILYRY